MLIFHIRVFSIRDGGCRGGAAVCLLRDRPTDVFHSMSVAIGDVEIVRRGNMIDVTGDCLRLSIQGHHRSRG